MEKIVDLKKTGITIYLDGNEYFVRRVRHYGLWEIYEVYRAEETASDVQGYTTCDIRSIGTVSYSWVDGIEYGPLKHFSTKTEIKKVFAMFMDRVWRETITIG